MGNSGNERKDRTEEKGRFKVEKWRSVKIDEDTHILVKKLAILLDMKEYMVIKISVFLTAFLIQGNIDVARKTLRYIKHRYARRAAIIERTEEYIEKLLEED